MVIRSSARSTSWIVPSHRLHLKPSATRDKSPRTPLHYFFWGGGRFITINRQRIIQIMYIRAEMKDIRNIH